MSTYDPKAEPCQDLGAIGSTASYDNISYSGGVDTITLDPLQMSTNITLPTGGYAYTPTGSTTYSISGSPLATSTGTFYTSASASYSTVNITNQGITMPTGTDIKIGNQSLSEFMTKMEERLAILVPDPNKLEKFEALKKAYDHYKLMEKLCQEEPKKED